MLPFRRMEQMAKADLNSNHSRRYRWRDPEANRETIETGPARAFRGRTTAEEGSTKAELHKMPGDSGILLKPKTASLDQNERDIGSFVKTYVDRRTEDDTVDASAGSRIQKNLYERKEGWPKYFVPLRFDEDVMFYRLEDQRAPKLSFRDVDATDIYRLDPKAFRNKNERLARKARPAGLATKHGPCLPSEPRISRDVYHAKKRPNMAKVGAEKEPSASTTKTTHLWEKHVLGLLSRRTAQWIANQCSSGEQRERLVGYLDEKYLEHYLLMGGASRITKILDVNDDAICWPVKRKTHPENV